MRQKPYSESSTETAVTSPKSFSALAEEISYPDLTDSIPIAIDPLIPYTGGQIRLRNDGLAAIYMSEETAADPVLAPAIIAHELAHYRFQKHPFYRQLKQILRAPSYSNCWFLVIYGSVSMAILYPMIFQVAPLLPSEFRDENSPFYWWFMVINFLAVIGATWILMWIVRLPIAVLDSIRSQIEELFADREAIRNGYRDGVLLYIESCGSRWWQLFRTHPPRGLRRFFAESIW